MCCNVRFLARYPDWRITFSTCVPCLVSSDPPPTAFFISLPVHDVITLYPVLLIRLYTSSCSNPITARERDGADNRARPLAECLRTNVLILIIGSAPIFHADSCGPHASYGFLFLAALLRSPEYNCGGCAMRDYACLHADRGLFPVLQIVMCKVSLDAALKFPDAMNGRVRIRYFDDTISLRFSEDLIFYRRWINRRVLLCDKNCFYTYIQSFNYTSVLFEKTIHTFVLLFFNIYSLQIYLYKFLQNLFLTYKLFQLLIY